MPEYEMSSIVKYIDRRWWYGGPWDLWIKNLDLIEIFIKENQLQPVPVEHSTPGLRYYMSPTSPKEGDTRPEFIQRIDFPGGIRLAHLHYKDDIFLLTDEQWAKFTREVIKGFREKLEKANIVSFEQLGKLSDAIDSLVI